MSRSRRAVRAFGHSKSLVAATPQAQLAERHHPKVVKGLRDDQVALMERESASLEREFKMAEQSYSSDHLDLVLAEGYLANLLRQSCTIWRSTIARSWRSSRRSLSGSDGRMKGAGRASTIAQANYENVAAVRPLTREDVDRRAVLRSACGHRPRERRKADSVAARFASTQRLSCDRIAAETAHPPQLKPARGPRLRCAHPFQGLRA
jgi:hypothetical protein